MGRRGGRMVDKSPIVREVCILDVHEVPIIGVHEILFLHISMCIVRYPTAVGDSSLPTLSHHDNRPGASTTATGPFSAQSLSLQ
jgi:hypothetical protein